MTNKKSKNQSDIDTSVSITNKELVEKKEEQNMTQINIPESIEQKLSKHSEQFGISTEDLKTEMLEYLPQVKTDYPKLDFVKQMTLAYRQLTTRLAQEEGGVKSKAIIHTGFFLGDSGIKDESQKKINKIKRMPPEERVKYHPDEDTWLNYKEGKDFMKPIESLDHKTLYAIASTGNEVAPERTKFAKLNLWREAVRSVTPDHDIMYTFRANPKVTDKQLPAYDLGATKFTKLRSGPVLTESEKYEMIKNSGKEIFNVNDIEFLYESRFKRDTTPRVPGAPFVETPDPVFIEANVSSVTVREEKSNIINIFGEDENGMMKFYTAYMGHNLPIKFKDNDRVIFLADIGQLTFESKPDETQTVLYVKGFFVVPVEDSLNFV
jgi:hypothetical protein